MITVVCTLEVERVGWLPQFVAHYRALGVERFLLSLHLDETASDDEVRRATYTTAQVLDPLGVRLRRVIVVPFSAMALREHHDSLQATDCRPHDWIVWCDIDDLQGYARPLPALCDAWDAAGINIVPGEFVDRVAANGCLPAFDPQRPLWDQFPLGCDLTSRVLKGSTRKVVCSKGNVKIARANHTPLHGQDLCSAQSIVDIHHFKWDATVVGRLSRRLEESWRKRCPWWIESQRALQHIQAHGGRIGIEQLRTYRPREPFYRQVSQTVAG